MSLYNLSNGRLAETKISDFLVGDLLKSDEDSQDALTDDELELADTEEINPEEEEPQGFVEFLTYGSFDNYSRNVEDDSFIKEEISLSSGDEEASKEVSIDYENALSFDKLPRFAVEEEEEIEEEDFTDVDLSDLEGLSEEERTNIENAFKIAEIRKVLDEMLRKKTAEAKAVLETAEEEAVLMRQTAEYAADKIKKDAYIEAKAKGHSDGYQEGMKEAQETIAAAIERETHSLKEEVAKVIESVTQAKSLILGKYENDLRDLAISTAEKIVKVSLQSSGEVIQGMILSAVEELQKTKWLKVYLSRYDFELLKETDYDLIDTLASVSEDVKIVVMEDEPLGTAIVETPQQVIDLSVRTQLDNIKEIIDNAL